MDKDARENTISGRLGIDYSATQYEEQAGMVQTEDGSRIFGNHARGADVRRHHSPHQHSPQAQEHDPEGPCKTNGTIRSSHFKVDIGLSQPHSQIYC